MMIAAETEIFKLSVKPTIGILEKPSALKFLPIIRLFLFQKKALGFNIKIFHQTIILSCGVVAMICSLTLTYQTIRNAVKGLMSTHF
jgi:hypothetical protein